MENRDETLIGYRYVPPAGSDLPGSITQGRVLSEAGCNGAGLTPIATDKAPNRGERDLLLVHPYALRDGDTLVLADARLLADNRRDAARVLRSLAARQIKIMVAGEKPRPAADTDYWMPRIVPSKGERMKALGKAGRPRKWDIEAQPKDRITAIAALYYSGAPLTAALDLCRKYGAPLDFNKSDIWRQLGPKNGTRKPDWAK